MGGKDYEDFTKVVLEKGETWPCLFKRKIKKMKEKIKEFKSFKVYLLNFNEEILDVLHVI